MKTKLRAEKLGMPHGTACGRLRTSVIYMLVQKLNLNYCYRCNNEIKAATDLAIDHKEAWEYSSNPAELFFDLDNISFSHRSCNIKAGKRIKIYSSKKDQKSAQFKRYYSRHKEKRNKLRNEKRRKPKFEITEPPMEWR